MHRSKQAHGRSRFYSITSSARVCSVAGKDLPYESPCECQVAAVIHLRPLAVFVTLRSLTGRTDAWFIAVRSHANVGIGTLGARQIRIRCCGSALLLIAVLQT